VSKITHDSRRRLKERMALRKEGNLNRYAVPEQDKLPRRVTIKHPIK
jgi:hypothetical protein